MFILFLHVYRSRDSVLSLIAILGVIIFSDIFIRKSKSHLTNIYSSYLEFNNFSLIQSSVKVERNILASALKKIVIKSYISFISIL